MVPRRKLAAIEVAVRKGQGASMLGIKKNVVRSGLTFVLSAGLLACGSANDDADDDDDEYSSESQATWGFGHGSAPQMCKPDDHHHDRGRNPKHDHGGH